jgi:hypothetical protein
MRLVCIVALFCVLGCSNAESVQSSTNTERQAGALITLENLVFVDASSADTEHPLVCGTGRDFPDGRELAFRDSESGKSVHAVFPEAATAPDNLNGSFVLHGHFQGIQKRDSYQFKKPEEDYRYFVVSSWEQNK